MTCPLLKEYAIPFFVSRANDLVQSDSFEKLHQSVELTKELMTAIAKNSKNSIVIESDSGFGTMTVNSLRKKLSEKGLGLDGSKEMLISRLESSNKRPREE